MKGGKAGRKRRGGTSGGAARKTDGRGGGGKRPSNDAPKKVDRVKPRIGSTRGDDA